MLAYSKVILCYKQIVKSNEAFNHFKSGHFYPLPVQANFKLLALSHFE
ncbi:unnamed protein product [Staurois parvus]|uniref:Uncharacterized protein n=1 Tax=Staurois parvus TaxID=386267 RepID=A0ABN9B4E0_9NEOB|nr:unnamed protein product [Staurois parvus]